MQRRDDYDGYTASPSRIIIDINARPPTSAPPPSTAQTPSGDGGAKKRGINRACDACRRRKTRCDGSTTPDNICTNCLQSHKSCTYAEASKPRGPPKAYVTRMEDKLERLEALLKKLRPNEDFSDELGPLVIRDSWKTEDANVEHRMLSVKRDISPSLPTVIPSLVSLVPPLGEPQQIVIGAPTPPRVPGHIKTESDDNGLSLVGLPESPTCKHLPSAAEDGSEFSAGLARLSLRGTNDLLEDDANQLRYHGGSSTLTFAEAAKKFKERQAQEAKSTDPRDGGFQSRSTVDTPRPMHMPTRRPEYWRTPLWELTWEGVKHESTSFLAPFIPLLPPPDLAKSLIGLYFLHVNTQFPLLHRPTFERYWKEGLVEKDVWFTCLCFSLFAVASRWSNDPRVLDETPLAMVEHVWWQAGAKYFNAAMEITRMRRSLFNPGCLFEIQSVFLLADYLRGTPTYSTGWLFISIGLRKSQDLGAHRKSSYKETPSVAEESWRRAFWLMVTLDRIASALMGTPAVIAEADFDVDLPLEVDDDYWENEDPSLAFKQPSDKPSKVAFFNSWAKLSQIIAFATKTIYAVNKSKVFIGASSSRWPQEVLEKMNKALGEFMESVPPHLRWSKDIHDEIFANQSAWLHTTYYVTQILIHCPFIFPSSDGSSDGDVPYESPAIALEICTSAARACARIFEVQARKGFAGVQNMINCAHICAKILLIKVGEVNSRVKRHPLDSHEDAATVKELMHDVGIFMKALESLESRLEVVRIFLNELRKIFPSSNSDGVDVSPPFTVPSMQLDLPVIPAHRVPETSPNTFTYQQDVPSSFQHGWQWYTSAPPPPNTPREPQYQEQYPYDSTGSGIPIPGQHYSIVYNAHPNEGQHSPILQQTTMPPNKLPPQYYPTYPLLPPPPPIHCYTDRNGFSSGFTQTRGGSRHW
ncbi:hypothetical protein BDN71DRAFT_1492196 [Pleurotus eryngii]|uniref:Zn(2)-C6 fungal-type domain-containing protein n=1 Tax=Pleurotus eryngii TaxID=5323 RepID=A0A9P6A7C9_PLEER|nr:hypothetical protein BDN71DRAFT_1492196 [Pleurotus eryngii]